MIMFEIHTGEMDVRICRLLSVSNTFASEINESVSGLESDFTYGYCGIDKMKSIISSGTKPQIIPGSLHFVTCTSDIDNDYKSMDNESSHDDTDNKREQILSMPVSVTARNRRAALGDIFQDTEEADFNHILSIYESRTVCDELRDMPEEDTPQSRRMALADIFQGVSARELEHILSTDDDQGNDSMLEVPNNCRRMTLADMFENINEEQLQNIVRRSSQVHDCSRSSDVYETIDTPLSCRRCALADIFDDIDLEDVQTLLSTYGNETMEEDCAEKISLCRRFALADIFCDISEDDLWRIIELSYDSDDDEAEQVPRQSHSCGRRLALADIFCDIREEDIMKVLSDDYEENYNAEDRDYPVSSVPAIRRAALGDIFRDVASNDMLDFISKYGTARVRN